MGKVRQNFACFIEVFEESFNNVSDSLGKRETIKSEMTRMKIGQVLVKRLIEMVLSIENFAGQVYDGAD